MRRRNVRQRFKTHLHLSVLARLVSLVEFDLRLQRRTDIIVSEQLLHAILNRALQRFPAQAVAVHLSDEVRRDLARPESGHTHLRRDTLHLLLDTRLDVLGGDGQHEGALEALVLSLDGLDGHVAQFPMNSLRAITLR